MYQETDESSGWSHWFALASRDYRAAVDARAGLYRVRCVGSTGLAYVGQTSTLRRRLQQLSVLYKVEIPYNDPHTAAPGLWVLRTTQGATLEAATLVMTGDVRQRKAAECVVISEHREQIGVSPLVNFGRMPNGWVKSTGNNSALVARGGRRRGFADAAAIRAPDYPCCLDRTGPPTSPAWAGLPWSAWHPLDQGLAATGVYRVRHPGEERLVYVGQGRIGDRLRAHLAKAKSETHRQASGFAGAVEASWVRLPDLASSQLLEIECDLIASHVLTVGEPPAVQFLG